jgi:hypothetical protein
MSTLPTPKTAACKLLESEFEKNLAEVTKGIRAPETMLRSIEREIDKLENEALRLADDALDKLPGIPGDILATADGLEELLDCPFIEDTKWAGMIEDALDRGLGLHQTVKSFIKKTIIGAAMEVFGSTMEDNGILGRLYRLKSEYERILRETGLLDAVKTMGNIIDCLSAVCDSTGTFAESYENITERLHLDVEGKPPENILELLGFDTEKQEIILEETEKIHEEYTRIQDWDFLELEEEA